MSSYSCQMTPRKLDVRQLISDIEQQDSRNKLYESCEHTLRSVQQMLELDSSQQCLINWSRGQWNKRTVLKKDVEVQVDKCVVAEQSIQSLPQLTCPPVQVFLPKSAEGRVKRKHLPNALLGRKTCTWVAQEVVQNSFPWLSLCDQFKEHLRTRNYIRKKCLRVSTLTRLHEWTTNYWCCFLFVKMAIHFWNQISTKFSTRRELYAFILHSRAFLRWRRQPCLFLVLVSLEVQEVWEFLPENLLQTWME